jgi:hypothetical protein
MMGVVGLDDAVKPPAILADASAKTQFDYEALSGNSRRKSPRTGTKRHMDSVVTLSKARTAQNLTENMTQNMVLAKWMISRHLDAVTRFYFDVDPNAKVSPALKERILQLFEWHAAPRNFDAARRHSRDSAFRMFETHKVKDGDALMVKIGKPTSPRYGSLQLVSGTRIARPKDLPAAMLAKVSDRGLELDKYGGVNAYIVCKYNAQGNDLLYDSRILADQAIYGGYFDGYDQTRGVSPLLVAANTFMDVSEGMEANLLKIKLHALFGYYVSRDLAEAEGDDGLPSTSVGVEDSDVDAGDGHQGGDTQQEINFSQGPVEVNLSPGEKIGLIESQTPPESVKEYTELAIRIALLSLDIPYTFFDGRKSSFAHVVADRKLYHDSVMHKQSSNKQAYDEYKNWKLRQWVADGKIEFDGNVEELFDIVKVRPYPSPWLDRLNEIAFEERSIALGLKSIPGLGREHNIDVYKNVEETGKFLEFARSKNVPIYIGVPGARSDRDADIQNDIAKEEANERQDQDEQD